MTIRAFLLAMCFIAAALSAGYVAASIIAFREGDIAEAIFCVFGAAACGWNSLFLHRITKVLS